MVRKGQVGEGGTRDRNPGGQSQGSIGVISNFIERKSTVVCPLVHGCIRETAARAGNRSALHDHIRVIAALKNRDRIKIGVGNTGGGEESEVQSFDFMIQECFCKGLQYSSRSFQTRSIAAGYKNQHRAA